MGRHLTRWLIPLPAIVLSFWPTLVRAETQPGLQTTYYTIDAIPPIQSTAEYPICGSEVENNINRSYDGEPYLDCTYDLFMVHMTGFIEIPEHQTIEFMLASDDGGEITIDGNLFGVWYDQGCTWTESGPLQLDAASVPLELFMYENGGGTCVMLAWNIDNVGWEMVPDSAFTQQAVASITSSTNTSTTTTTPTTSTTVEESTTTTSTSSSTTSTSTTLPPTTTTITTEPVQSSTTTSTTSTTTTTTTTVAPAPTTTQAPYTPPRTTTTSEPVASTTSSTTTTTSLPEPETTVEETSTTTYLPDPDTTVPQSSSTLPAETTPQTTQPTPETSTPQTTEPEVESSSTTTLPEPGKPISDEKVAEILTELKTAAPAQIVAAIEQVLASNITTDQAVSIASSPEVLAAITQDQAEAIFEQIVVEELSVEQADELVAALNEAPTKAKKAFQETINVFTGLFDSFQMVGQTIPVGERRTLVAVSNTLVAVGASLRRRSQ